MKKDLQQLFVFDFDGTVTKKDTLIAFIKYCFGTWRLIEALLIFSPLLVLMKLRLVNNGKTKEKLFGYFFHGMTLEHFNDLCFSFAVDTEEHIINTNIFLIIDEVKDRKVPVFIDTASIENWVSAFFYDGHDEYEQSEDKPIRIIGTQVEVKDGRLTGRFSTPNCYGPEKVRRLEEAFPDLKTNRSHYYIIAYGDSRGDREMMAYADKKILVK